MNKGCFGIVLVFYNKKIIMSKKKSEQYQGGCLKCYLIIFGIEYNSKTNLFHDSDSNLTI